MDLVLRKIENMSEDVKFLLQIVKRNALSEMIATPNDLISSINHEEELEEFNKKLGNDEVFFQNVVCRFQYGKNFRLTWYFTKKLIPFLGMYFAYIRAQAQFKGQYIKMN